MYSLISDYNSKRMDIIFVEIGSDLVCAMREERRFKLPESCVGSKHYGAIIGRIEKVGKRGIRYVSSSLFECLIQRHLLICVL